MTFRVQLNPSNKVFAAEKSETLLEAALRSGIALNYSCNTGACAECGGRLISGQVNVTQHHDFKFSDVQQAQGYVLLCCCAADSDLEIEAREVGG
jgi:CDP-4-dehydro-6-deoxyglucose reductase, E3